VPQLAEPLCATASRQRGADSGHTYATWVRPCSQLWCLRFEMLMFYQPRLCCPEIERPRSSSCYTASVHSGQTDSPAQALAATLTPEVQQQAKLMAARD